MFSRMGSDSATVCGARKGQYSCVTPTANIWSMSVSSCSSKRHWRVFGQAQRGHVHVVSEHAMGNLLTSWLQVDDLSLVGRLRVFTQDHDRPPRRICPD